MSTYKYIERVRIKTDNNESLIPDSIYSNTEIMTISKSIDDDEIHQVKDDHDSLGKIPSEFYYYEDQLHFVMNTKKFKETDYDIDDNDTPIKKLLKADLKIEGLKRLITKENSPTNVNEFRSNIVKIQNSLLPILEQLNPNEFFILNIVKSKALNKFWKRWKRQWLLQDKMADLALNEAIEFITNASNYSDKKDNLTCIIYFFMCVSQTLISISEIIMIKNDINHPSNFTKFISDINKTYNNIDNYVKEFIKEKVLYAAYRIKMKISADTHVEDSDINTNSDKKYLKLKQLLSKINSFK